MPLLLSVMALALGAQACASKGPLDVGFQGSDLDYRRAQEAAELWTSACGEQLVYVHRGNGDVTMSGVAASDGLDGAVAYTKFVPGLDGEHPTFIHYDEARDEHLRPLVMAHEMGHALGLHHTANGLMQPSVQENDGAITSDECAAVNRD